MRIRIGIATLLIFERAGGIYGITHSNKITYPQDYSRQHTFIKEVLLKDKQS